MSNANKKIELLPLKWDTDYFGIKSARVNILDNIDVEEQKEILNFSKNFQFVTIANNNNLNENNYWIGTKTDAFLTDMNIQLFKKINNKPNLLDGNTFIINNFSRNKQVIEIAEKSFVYSRFFNDPHLPYEQSSKIYVHWMEHAFNKEDKYFVISEREGQIAGFILFSFQEENSAIELIAVDEYFQGQRVGKSLIHAMESFILSKGFKYIKVGTQVKNISALNFYNAIGFKYMSCSSIYHLWTPNHIG